MSPATLVVECPVGGREGQQVIQLIGRLTLESVFRFEQTLKENEAPSTIVDLSQVEFIDSAGLGSLVMAHTSHERAGRRLALVGVTERTAKLLSIAGLTPVLTIFDTVEKAEEALA